MWLRRIIITLVASLLLRLVIGLVIMPEMPQVEDGPSYKQQALEILDGSATFFFFPPGTALCSVPFYALLGRSFVTDHFIATAFWMFFAASAAWFAWIVADSKKVAWYATLMAAFLPHSILATVTLSSQPLAAGFVTAGLCCTLMVRNVWSWQRWLLACVCFALAVVTRPASLTIVFILIGTGGWLVIKRHMSYRQFISSLSLLVVTLGVVIVPIMRQNASNNQGWTISTNNEWNLFVGNNPYTPDYKTGHFGQRKIADLPDDARRYLSGLLPHQEPANATMQERLAMQDSAVSYIKHHPWRSLYRISNRFRGLWGMDYTASRELQNVYHLSGRTTGMLLVLEGGGFLFILVLACFGAMYKRSYNLSNLFIMQLIASLILPYLVAFSVAKYHTVLLPFLFPLAASSLMWITSKTERSVFLTNYRYRVICIALIIAAIQVEHVFHIVEMR